MYGKFGGGLNGAGIAQNAFFTVPAYVDNDTSSTMLVSYAISASALTISNYNYTTLLYPSNAINNNTTSLSNKIGSGASQL